MMAAELGQTNDPKALVPGDPDAVHETIVQLTIYGDALHDAGTGLKRIDTTEGWSGLAADRFREVFDGQPGKWLEAGDAFRDAATALDAYVSTLVWAQEQAGAAVRLWEEGQALTKQAKAQHDQAIRQARQQAAVMTAMGVLMLAPAIPFHDPGESKRAAARDMLNRARSQLHSAGDTAARTIGQARDKAPEKPNFWQQAGDVLSDIGDGALDVGRHLVNGLASASNAMIGHPGDVALTVGGAALTAISGIGEGGGLVLDATGVGAVAGVPLNAVSAAGMATGAGMVGLGTANIMRNAAGDDHVSPLQTSKGGAGRAGATPGKPPSKINGATRHGQEQALGRDGGRGVSDSAMDDAVQNPIKPPEPQPGGSFKYVGKDAVVMLNPEGKVVTTWAKSSAGWRNP